MAEDINQVVSSIEALARGVGESNKLLGTLDTNMRALNTTFTASAKSMATVLKNLTGISKGVTGIGVEAKKTKKIMETTWVDMLDTTIIQTLERQIKAIKELNVGTEKFGDNLEALAKSKNAFEVADPKDIADQINALQLMDKKLQQISGSVAKMSSSKFSMRVDSGDSLQRLGKMRGEMDAVKLQAGLAKKVLDSSFNIDTDPFMKRLNELNPAFKQTFDAIRASARTQADELKGLLKDVVPELSQRDITKLGARGADPESVRKGLQQKVDRGEDVSGDLAKMGKSLTTEVSGGNEEQKKVLESCLSILEAEGESKDQLEKALVSYKLMAKSGHDLVQVHDNIKKAMAIENSLSDKIAKRKIDKAGKGGVGAILGGFANGGFKGGMSAMADSIENKRKAILNSGMSKEQQVAAMQKSGYKISTDAEGNTSYKAGFMNSLRQGVAQLAQKGGGELLKGAVRGEGTEAFKGIISGSEEAGADLAKLGSGAVEGSEGLEVAAGASEGLGAAASGVGMALGGLAVGIMAVVAIFKIAAAIADHVAKNYREVRQVGGVSGLMGGSMRGGVSDAKDLRASMSEFRLALAKGGGDALHPGPNSQGFYMLLEKKLEVLGVAQKAGLNAGRMQQDITRKSSAGTDYSAFNAEEFSSMAKYLQVSAETAELLGMDLKEAAGEVATLHEELSMSFESVEMFLMNVTRSATAAGVSNEKFMKITRSLANEQINYGTELKNTSRLLETLGASGKYTSETLKKAFESLIPDKQSIEQRTVAMYTALQNPGTKAGMLSSLQSSIDDLDAQKKALEETIASKTSSASQVEEAQKQRQALMVKWARVHEMHASTQRGDAYGMAANLQYASPETQLQAASGAISAQNKGAAAVLQSGGSVEDLIKATQSISPGVREALEGVFGTSDLMGRFTNMESIIQGSMGSMMDAFYDANGQLKDVAANADSNSEEYKEFISMLKLLVGSEAGNVLKAMQANKGNKDVLLDVLKKHFTKDGHTIVSSGNLSAASAATKAIQAASEFTKTNADSLRSILQQSNAAGTDVSEKMKQWMEPKMEEANSFLSDMVTVMSGEFKKGEQALIDRKKKIAVQDAQRLVVSSQGEKDSALRKRGGLETSIGIWKDPVLLEASKKYESAHEKAEKAREAARLAASNTDLNLKDNDALRDAAMKRKVATEAAQKKAEAEEKASGDAVEVARKAARKKVVTTADNKRQVAEYDANEEAIQRHLSVRENVQASPDTQIDSLAGAHRNGSEVGAKEGMELYRNLASSRLAAQAPGLTELLGLKSISTGITDLKGHSGGVSNIYDFNPADIVAATSKPDFNKSKITDEMVSKLRDIAETQLARSDLSSQARQQWTLIQNWDTKNFGSDPVANPVPGSGTMSTPAPAAQNNQTPHQKTRK